MVGENEMDVAMGVVPADVGRIAALHEGKKEILREDGKTAHVEEPR